ncbi:MAG: inorganic phosphate transporter [Candidatus Kapabacteria bacterium]|nr:inorganic phosphate transporter [Candidatus Kapabacteria bacterium]
MDTIWILVIISVTIALAFDVINGFHDAANSIATVVSTRVLSPRFAVMWAAFFNFIAMFIFEPKVANTVSKIVNIQAKDPAFVYVVLAGLIGAIIWDILTWFWGLPTSSSHALIGGLAGAGIAYKGTSVVNIPKITQTIEYIPIAPLLGMLLGFGVMIGIYWMFRKFKPAKVDQIFRKGQLVSAALYSIGHGGNDAQKTMGIILAVFVAAGIFAPDTALSFSNPRTSWIILSCNLAMGIGTAMGGWRIVKTMGMKLTKLKPVHGFCAETAGAATLFLVTYLGIPVSTTHTIAGSIIGVGVTTHASSIKWTLAMRIVMSWIVTIPLSGIMAALSFYLLKMIHGGF